MVELSSGATQPVALYDGLCVSVACVALSLLPDVSAQALASPLEDVTLVPSCVSNRRSTEPAGRMLVSAARPPPPPLTTGGTHPSASPPHCVPEYQLMAHIQVMRPVRSPGATTV